jgi:hypothetical protein
LLAYKVVIGGLVVIVLAIDPRFADSNPTEDDGFLRTIKSISLLRKVSKAVLQHIKDPYGV